MDAVAKGLAAFVMRDMPAECAPTSKGEAVSMVKTVLELQEAVPDDLVPGLDEAISADGEEAVAAAAGAKLWALVNQASKTAVAK